MSVTASRVGVHCHRIESTFRNRVCCRCGLHERVSERRANADKETGVDISDYRCEDCRPVKFWR